MYGSEHSFSHKTAFIEKAADSSFYVLGNRSVFAEELNPNTYLAKFDISGNELWRINNHAYNEIEAKDPIAQAVSLVVSEYDTVLTVESRLIDEHKTQLTKRNSEGELL